ncbi:hypothetical protein RIF29_34122 [Crotalaria pallida]|uniref:Uncharacterized protein n=1 Tax=Crotalaria pallida TaxID=3830 RepID=A0AAN9HTD7_CROPI
MVCKSRRSAFEDFYHPTPKFLLPNFSCKNTVQNLKRTVELPISKPIKIGYDRVYTWLNPKEPKPKPREPKPKPSLENRFKSPTAKEHELELGPRINNATSAQQVMELPEGHDSRNVVDTIFRTSWGPKQFSGRVETVFKIQNGAREVSQFEEFREAVKARAAAAPSKGERWEDSVRCVADGNEVMRFLCLDDGGFYDGAAGNAWSFPERKGTAICTFSGSGEADERGGGSWGRRAMLVCRVVAGRVSKELGLLEKRVAFDSVSEDNGELLVFDSRAVLPCFLIIYTL